MFTGWRVKTDQNDEKNKLFLVNKKHFDCQIERIRNIWQNNYDQKRLININETYNYNKTTFDVIER